MRGFGHGFKLKVCSYSSWRSLNFGYILGVNPFLQHFEETITIKNRESYSTKGSWIVLNQPAFLTFGWVPYKWPKIDGFEASWWFQIFFIFTPSWGRFPFWRLLQLDGFACGYKISPLFQWTCGCRHVIPENCITCEAMEKVSVSPPYNSKLGEVQDVVQGL